MMKIKRRLQNWLHTPDKVALARITYLEEEVHSLKRQIGKFNMLAADVAFHKNDQTQIIIASKLGKGYVKVISAHYNTLRDLTRHIKELERKFKPEVSYYDAPDLVQALTRGHITDE